MIISFWIIRAWEIYTRFIEGMPCLLGQASEICLKSLGQNVSHEETFFCRKRIYFPNVFFTLLAFFISIVFFKEVVGGGKLSMLMIFRIWALYYAYTMRSNYWQHSKSTYALMEDRGGTPKTCENVQREGAVFQEYTRIYFLYFLMECFHILTAYFCF